MFIPIQPAKIDASRCGRDSFQQRSLLNAVSALDAAADQDRHDSGESRNESFLMFLESDPAVNVPPLLGS